MAVTALRDGMNLVAYRLSLADGRVVEDLAPISPSTISTEHRRSCPVARNSSGQ
jgi:hypothetical protein